VLKALTTVTERRVVLVPLTVSLFSRLSHCALPMLTAAGAWNEAMHPRQAQVNATSRLSRLGGSPPKGRVISGERDLATRLLMVVPPRFVDIDKHIKMRPPA
jgi:hypothetical protein